MIITVIFKEHFSPKPPVYPDPLIYTVDVEFKGKEPDDTLDSLSEEYHDEILECVALQRANELSIDAVKEVASGIELMFAFVGNLTPLMDWRR